MHTETEIRIAVDNAAQFFINQYLKWFDDYLSIDKFAEDHGITREKAEKQIRIGRKIHNQMTNTRNTINQILDHPE